MRVRVVCDPPLLTEVVELALSRIDGVELARDTSAATQPDRTITLDDATELPRLVEEVTAWVFQSNSGEFTLCVNGRPGDHVATSGNSGCKSQAAYRGAADDRKPKTTNPTGGNQKTKWIGPRSY